MHLTGCFQGFLFIRTKRAGSSMICLKKSG